MPTPTSNRNTGPVSWNTRRYIDGHPGYTWHYHDKGSAVRVVMRPDPAPGTTVVGTVREAHIGGRDVLAAYDDQGATLGTGITIRECAALVADADATRNNPAVATAMYERAYNYALGVLDAAPAGVSFGVSDEADVEQFANAYRAQFELNPHDLPHVRTAFGEWRTTGGIAPQD